jgi:uroporphyrinogen decarboxylase
MAAMSSESSDPSGLFLRACRRDAVPRPPVWFMRQAGRSLPEYRAVRSDVPMLQACRTPELVCEVTLQPVRRHAVDAAILFSDIVVPLAAAGVDLEIKPAVGPVLTKPVASIDDVAALRPLHAEDVDFVTEAIGLLIRELGVTPLIGFAGAPFTLASYLVEGGPSRTHAKTKALMYGAPTVWHALCDRLAGITLEFLRVQATAGVAAVQLFDSWAGALSEADYRRFVLPHSTAVLGSMADEFPRLPRIHFGVGTGELLTAMADAGATVVGVDWRTPIDVASGRLGSGVAVQGNLDPCVPLAPWSVVETEVRRIVAEGRRSAGHVFNLGHGVLPETDPEVLTRIVSLIRELGDA